MGIRGRTGHDRVAAAMSVDRPVASATPAQSGAGQASRSRDADATVDAERRLSAVVFLDMVGYSRLMQLSEEQAEAAVLELWGIARPALAARQGEEVRLFGDGMLAVFDSALYAVRFCLKVLHELAQRNAQPDVGEKLLARAGVHLGDVARRDGEIYGHGVNIAARLVGVAPPGAVVISAHVHDQVRNVLKHPVRSLGSKRLYNIAVPLELFCLAGPECDSAAVHVAAQGANGQSRIWHIGDARFDEGQRALHRDDTSTELDVSTCAVLSALLNRAGETVTHQELQEAAGDASRPGVARRIARLRSALGDSNKDAIVAQVGVGYRIVATVRVGAAPDHSLTRFDFAPGDNPPMRPMWVLERLLGRGGQGEAWLARHAKTGEFRVYKFALNSERLGPLKREITLSRMLSHVDEARYFVRVLDWNLDRAPFFLECTYGGLSLAEWTREQGGLEAIPLRDRLGIAAQIAEALAAAHSIGVLHKDLKPDNVLIRTLRGSGTSWEVRIVDFGSGGLVDARRLADVGITDMGFSRSAMLEERTAGTPVYCAPELFAGHLATVQADVYALGIILYQLVVGDLRKPLSTGWEEGVEDALLRDDILRATHGDPALRLADAAEFARRIRHLDERRARRENQLAQEQRLAEAAQAAEDASRELTLLRTRRRFSVAFTIALLMGLGLVLYQQQRAERAAVQAVASAEEAQAVADFLAQDLFASVGESPLRTLSIGGLLERGVDKLDQRQQQLPVVGAQLYLSLGNAALAAESFALAARAYDRALDNYEIAGELGTPVAMRAAAQLLRLQDSDVAALPGRLPRFQLALASGMATLGEAHPDVLGLQRQLAEAQWTLGHWKLAAAQLEAVWSRAQGAGAGVADIFDGVENRLALAWHQLGEYHRAEQLLRQVLGQAQARDLPPPHVAALQTTLASVLIELDQLSEADRLLQAALRAVRNWVADDSSLMVQSVQERRGWLRLRQGQSEEAVALLEGVLRVIDAEPLLAGSGVSGEVRSRLAWAHRANGDGATAATALRDAVDIKRAAFGDKSPQLQLSLCRLADLELDLGPLPAAEATLASVDRRSLGAIGPDHPYSAELARVTARLRSAQGRNEDAERWMREAIRIYALRYDNDHSVLREARATLQAYAEGG